MDIKKKSTIAILNLADEIDNELAVRRKIREQAIKEIKSVEKNQNN